MADDLTKPFDFYQMKPGGGRFVFPDISGLLFGGGDSALDEYLTPAQKQSMGRQALLQAAMAIGQASGPSTTPRSLMQILGSGVQAGTAGYQGAQKNAIEQMLTKQKLDEARREANLQKFFMDRLSGAAPSAAVTPSMPVSGQPLTAMQAAALPTPVYGVGPTPQRAAMIGQTLPNESGTISPVTVTARVKMLPTLDSILAESIRSTIEQVR